MHTYIHTYSISPVTVRPRWGVARRAHGYSNVNDGELDASLKSTFKVTV